MSLILSLFLVLNKETQKEIFIAISLVTGLKCSSIFGDNFSVTIVAMFRDMVGDKYRNISRDRDRDIYRDRDIVRDRDSSSDIDIFRDKNRDNNRNKNRDNFGTKKESHIIILTQIM